MIKVFFVTCTLLLLSACGGSSSKEAKAPTSNADTSAPNIVMAGESTVTITHKQTYTELGATATDAVDGSVTVTTTGTVDKGTVGMYTITYTASDKVGNTSTATRTVIIVAIVNTGVFIDSAVAGINYRTKSLSGTTNASGEYDYIEGETVTFSIGSIDLPATAAKKIVTPLDLVGTIELENQTVVNISRLLQSLDLDSDTSNGIEIATTAHATASNMSVDFNSESFETDVKALVENSGSATVELVSAETAIAHLSSSLEIPTAFTVEYLSGKTLYNVYFGTGQDPSNPAVDVENVTVVSEITFNADQSVTVVGLQNSGSISADSPYPWHVNEGGLLVEDINSLSGSMITCGSTVDYIKTAYLDDEGNFDNIDLFFFDKNKALAFAETLTESIPSCTITAIAEPLPNVFNVDYLAGQTLFQVYNGPTVIKFTYNLDMTANYIVLIEQGLSISNADTVAFNWGITAEGLLYEDADDTSTGNLIVCGSTDKYIKTHYLNNNGFDGVDLFFFNEIDALNFAEALTEDIPACTQP